MTVSPDQLFGIELNRYAHELAQITVWIGYIQWKLENGFMEFEEPILKPLNQISLSDALTAANGDEKSRQPWPDVDVIIGNPPFLGSRKMRPVLGDEYCDDLIEIYKDRIHGFPILSATGLTEQKSKSRQVRLTEQACWRRKRFGAAPIASPKAN